MALPRAQLPARRLQRSRCMRTVVGLFLAAAAGLHCSAPADLPGTSSPELASEGRSSPPDASERATDATEARRTARVPNQLARPTGDLSSLIAGASTTHVTSTFVDPTTGATYAAGTFVDDVVIGGTVLKSKGDEDVFLLKVDALGTLEWVRAVGSAYAEKEPRVTLSGAEVNLIGMTAGRMDCGTGPLGSWSSATFFLCVFGASDGTSVSGGVFPTGTP